jgi:Ala-tRNA(Pro) deacylase
MTCRERLESYLRKQRVPFGVHVQAGGHREKGASEREHLPGQLLVKVMLVVADGQRVMLAFPASRQVDLTLVAALRKSQQVRPASEDELASTFPDCDAGAIPPFGALYDLPLIVDRSLEHDQVIFFPAGTQTIDLSLTYDDYRRIVAPTLAEITHPDYHEHAITTDMRRMGGMGGTC